jgi:[acyl-carrier-protein] S-malonyltransferase
MWASGCLDATQARRLVAGMARIQAGTRGAQILTTTLDDDWREDPALARAIEDALAATRARGPDWFVAHSIRLGGHEVLAGTESGVRALLEELPQVRLGERAFPLQLAGHGPFHTELCREVAQVALEELSDLPIRPPRVHLIDGRGDVHSPWSADPRGLLRYTLETQVVTTFDFTAAVRTALREFCPDVLLCAGPGTSLRAPVGHVVLREGYRGIHDKERLFATALVR